MERVHGFLTPLHIKPTSMLADLVIVLTIPSYRDNGPQGPATNKSHTLDHCDGVARLGIVSDR